MHPLYLLLPFILDPAPSASNHAPPGDDHGRDQTRLWGDVDGDGLKDIYVSNARGEDRLFINLGDGTFVDATEASGLAGCAGARLALLEDFDGDGAVDLLRLAADGGLGLYRGTGNGAFLDVTELLGLSGMRGALGAEWIDYDRDGLLDLRLETPSGAPILFHRLEARGFEQVELELPVAVPSAGAPAVLEPAPGASSAPSTTDGEARPSAARELAATLGSAPGTTAPFPGAEAGFQCVPMLQDAGIDGICLQASSSPTLGLLYPLTKNLFVDSAGKVGMQTIAPGAQLEVAAAGDVLLNDLGGSDPNLIFKRNGVESGRMWGDSTGALQFRGKGSGPNMTISSAGNVAIGTGAPPAKLGVDGRIRSSDALRVDVPGGTLQLGNYSQDNVPALELKNSKALSTWLIFPSDAEESDLHIYSKLGSGTVRIAGISGETADLYVEGDTSTATLTVRGGSDIVERFGSATGKLQPGTVVVASMSGDGSVEPSTLAYDPRIVGVVSGAGDLRPGLSLSQAGVAEGPVDVAMIGRIWVRCTGEGGSIEPGDLLTSAPTAGCAMRVADRERAFGAVLGKALGRPDAVTGLVLVLVNLQ